MPELEDLGSRNVVELQSIDLASGDYVPVFHRATNTVRRIPATEFMDGGDVTNAAVVAAIESDPAAVRAAAHIPMIDVTLAPYNAIADGMRVTDGVTNGTTTVTSASGKFVAGLGNFIRIAGARTAPTTTVTVVGGVITAVAVNVAGDNYGYRPNSTVECTFAEGTTSTSRARILGNTNALGAITSFTVVSGGSGYTTPTVVCPTAEFITTYTRVSDTQITLAVAAPNSGTGRVLFFGTDNTAAFQAAADDAATSELTRTVYIPPGAYLGNVSVSSGVKLVGAAGPAVHQNLITMAQIADRRYASMLLPATSASPVVLLNNDSFGCEVRDLYVVGSALRLGDGVRGGNGWKQNGWSFGNAAFSGLHVTGFNNGVVSSNATEVIVERCVVNDCNYGFTVSRSDGTTIRSNNTNQTINAFRFFECKAASVSSGDYNNSTGYFFTIEASSIGVENVNVETGSVGVFGLYSNIDLDVGLIKVLGTSGFFIDNFGTVGQTKVRVRIAPVGISGSIRAHRDHARYLPEYLPLGSYLFYCSDSALTTIVGSVHADLVYHPTGFGVRNSNVNLCEQWGGERSSPYGQLGWFFSAISDGVAPTTISNANSALRWDNNTSAAKTVLSFGKKYPIQESNFAMSFRVKSSSLAGQNIYMGLFETDTGVHPKNGMGVRFSHSLSDTTLKVTSIKNGTQTTVDIPGTSVSSLTDHTVNVSYANGYLTVNVLYNNSPSATASLALGSTGYGVNTTPSIFASYATTAQWLSFEGFSFKHNGTFY